MKKILILISLINILNAELYKGEIIKYCKDRGQTIAVRTNSNIDKLMDTMKKRMQREKKKSSCAYDIVIKDIRSYLKNTECKKCKKKKKIKKYRTSTY